MSEQDLAPLSADELAAEAGTALPPKEVISLLDLNVDLDLALDLAAPIDLAVAANANVAAPIDAAVGANVLSVGSTAQALADAGRRHRPGDQRRGHREQHPGQHARPGQRRPRHRRCAC